MATSFFAYPSQLREAADPIRQSLRIIKEEFRNNDHHGWEESDIAGKFLADDVLSKIDSSDFLAADITTLNFNVVYEIGYAIGTRKRVLVVKNSSLQGDEALIREVGLFDSIGYKEYQNSRSLASLLMSTTDLSPLSLVGSINTSAPVYVILPKNRTDLEIHLLSRIKKTKLRYRSFDPLEQPRLSGFEAINNTVSSYGVIIPLIPQVRKDARAHNMRSAFVAGLARGLEKEVLLLQFGDDPVPLDYRDLVSFADTLAKIDTHLSEFAPSIMGLMQAEGPEIIDKPATFLAKLNLGSPSAENEIRDLAEYYLETDEFRRVSRGEVQVVTGRKGSGKTALFFRLRDKVRAYRTNVVLDLRPEGYQLRKFKDVILAYLEQGTKEHTITAFWEYLLLLELCHKILDNDKQYHLASGKLFQPYQDLSKQYRTDEYVLEGDFAERMLKLTERIMEDFQSVLGREEGQTRLSTQKLTDLLYKHDTRQLRESIRKYLDNKREVWILFDNLDKGWPPRGLDDQDVLILRCLIEAIRKLERYFRREESQCYGVLFLRNDVFEMLVQNSTDRGKTSRVNIDWTDPEFLRELLRKRIVSNELSHSIPFVQIWNKICVSHIGTEETSTYLIDRCLMRPRSLIELAYHCRSHGVHLGHSRIEHDDIVEGEKAYSNELVENICLEMRDVFPELQPDIKDLLYEFIGANSEISDHEVRTLISNFGIAITSTQDQVLDILLWWSFFGIVKNGDDHSYIYSVNYNMNHLRAIAKKSASIVYCINPAFWKGLDIHHR